MGSCQVHRCPRGGGKKKPGVTRKSVDNRKLRHGGIEECLLWGVGLNAGTIGYWAKKMGRGCKIRENRSDNKGGHFGEIEEPKKTRDDTLPVGSEFK